MGTTALEVCEISKRYRSGKKWVEAVRQVSLNLASGEVLAFLGPNGAGKTTTIKMVAGLIRPDRGWVRIAGRDPHRESAALRGVGAVLEGNRNLYWRLTALENLEYFGVLRGLTRRQARRRSRELLERFELTQKRDATVQMLSRGMQQKLAIAAALLHDPPLLLLDEPTLGLDLEATQTVKRLVKEIAREGCAILLTTHQLDIAEELSDKVAIIQGGTIIARESTRQLIRQFSGMAYTVEVERALTLEQIQKLELLDVVFQGEHSLYLRGTDVFYQAMEILKPLPLVRVKREQGNLAEIFLKLLETPTPDS
ncbi:MAG: ABC transporter ATP-binding protein [Cyanobacteriota bacterium]|nr:ABC transporter ATP-binding protein [Cyanobacteriota bacterium]